MNYLEIYLYGVLAIFILTLLGRIWNKAKNKTQIFGWIFIMAGSWLTLVIGVVYVVYTAIKGEAK